jgi:bacteriocin biosynthesis cyclodehydratase domain-containing protein
MTFFSYRLDPRYFVVWRTPTSLQIGVDHAVARFDPVSRAEETMLHALNVGVGIEGLRMLADDAGGEPADVARFLERVKPALDSARASPFAGADIVVEGDSPAAVSLRRLLAQLVSRGGAPPATDTDTPPQLAIIVAAWAVRPAVAARWLRRDVAHLPVVFSDQEARIGPLVTPGAGPCMHCAHLAAIERDPAWVAIASQAFGRRAPSEEPLLVASVTAITARLVRGYLAADGRGLRPGVVVHVNATSGAVTETVRAVHPECACQALPESATQRGSASESPPCRPTTRQAVASLG